MLSKIYEEYRVYAASRGKKTTQVSLRKIAQRRGNNFMQELPNFQQFPDENVLGYANMIN